MNTFRFPPRRSPGLDGRRLGAALATLAAIAAAAVLASSGHDSSRAATARRVRAEQVLTSAPRRLLPSLSGYPIPAAASQQSLGVNAQFLFGQFPPHMWMMHATLMRENGIQIVRSDAAWGSAEPSPPSGRRHAFRWRTFDGIAGTLAEAHLRWLPVLDYSAPWDSSVPAAGVEGTFAAPRDPSLFAAFARAFVARYGPGGRFWKQHPHVPYEPVDAVEVWNEENTSIFWHPQPDPGAYLHLYELTRAAVHAVDPRVEALVGGLANNPATNFLLGLYAAGGNRRGLFDAVAVHPYAANADGVVQAVAAVRTVLDAHGDVDVPIDITEVGWPTRGLPEQGLPPITSDAQRATDFTSMTEVLARSDCGVERILPHTWVTQENSLLNPGQWFGIANPNGSLTQTAVAYANTLGSLESAPQRYATEHVCRSAPLLAVEPATPAQTHRALANVTRAAPAGSSAATPSTCLMLRLGYANAPLNGGKLALTFTPARGAGPARIVHRHLTAGSAGRAVACLVADHPTRGTLTIAAGRPDFVLEARRDITLRVR